MKLVKQMKTFEKLGNYLAYNQVFFTKCKKKDKIYI